MGNGAANQHISKQFDDELENVRAKVLAMGGLVEQQLNNALKSLIDGDIDLGKTVIDTEVQVNSYDVSIDQECTKILARRQPAASDLRLVMAITKTITDLERVGDEAEKIAKMGLELTDKHGPKSYYVGINAMGNLVSRLLHEALDAFARMDSKTAVEVASKELESDDQYVAILRQLITYMMEDPRNISGALDAVWVARALERIGDHSRNICENIIYLVEGEDVRHTSIKHMENIVSN
ncbi:MAG: phosphate transport system regulatory protein PhoU [marine bacterium B5-7]|nr:MAG: phosphate transport system regulatory protein PhoU [marine bacterium B5-7]